MDRGNIAGTVGGVVGEVLIRRLFAFRLSPLLYIILLFYIWTASSNGFALRGYTLNYNLLTDAFLNGQLNLPVNPSRELLALSDPYDPQQNSNYRLHDASLYHDKYFMYFGPVPVLTFYLPFRVLTGIHFPECLGVVYFSFAGLLFQMATLKFLIRRYAPATPGFFVHAATLILGISNFVPFILRRPAIYEAAIAAGFCFFAGAIFWLVRSVADPQPRPKDLMLASIFMGLAIGSRPGYLIISSLLGGGALCFLFRGRGKSDRNLLCETGALTFPFLIIFSGLLFYNYLRFDHCLEFGVTYQLSGSNGLRQNGFSPSHVWIAMKTYFFGKPVIDTIFPYFHPWLENPPQLPGIERVTGLLYSTPIIATALVLSPMLVFGRNNAGNPAPKLASAFTAIGVACGFFDCFFGVTERFMVDFVPWLLMGSIWIWIGLRARFAGSLWRRNCYHAPFILTSIYGLLFHSAISLAGYYDCLERFNPQTYNWIKRWFVH